MTAAAAIAAPCVMWNGRSIENVGKAVIYASFGGITALFFSIPGKESLLERTTYVALGACASLVAYFLFWWAHPEKALIHTAVYFITALPILQVSISIGQCISSLDNQKTKETAEIVQVFSGLLAINIMLSGMACIIARGCKMPSKISAA